MIKDLTILINTCEAYSDLWDGQISQLQKYWPNHCCKVILLTDTNKEHKKYEGIDIICAGEKKEITERLAFVYNYIFTKYIFITLDDYFLINNVDDERFNYLISEMESKDIKYIRLFNDPKNRKRVYLCNKVEKILFEENKSSYYINLYPGLWEFNFLFDSIDFSLNAWQYEVSLTKYGKKNKCLCGKTDGKEYIFLDVVRKGKILHKAKRYFKKNNVYYGNRPLISRKEEMRLKIISFLKKILSRKTVLRIKKKMSKKGYTFYSDANE